MQQDSEGRLAENILLFARTLRSTGVPVGTGQVIDALQAVTRAGIESRADLYWSLRAILVNRPSQIRLFDQAFHLYFRNPRLLERMMAMLLPTLEADSDRRRSEPAARRLLEALASDTQRESAEHEVVADQTLSYSRREILNKKDFEQMSLAEQAEAQTLLAEQIGPLRARPVRRFEASPVGGRIDLRRSMRLMQRGGSDYIVLARRRHRRRTPDLVLLCDISGSMSGYTRLFLHFAHLLSQRLPVVHSFVFGTRLTNISHRLADRDVDQAMQAVSKDVRDWDGGTRIADCIGEFNRRWSRRVLGRRAVLILLSDGLERDPESDLEFQMRRLKRSCQSLVWMNPMLRYEHFEAKASGIRRMLPHVDLFISAHNIDSLTTMWRAINGWNDVDGIRQSGDKSRI